MTLTARVRKRRHLNLHQLAVDELAAVVLVERYEFAPPDGRHVRALRGSHVAHNVTASVRGAHHPQRTRCAQRKKSVRVSSRWAYVVRTGKTMPALQHATAERYARPRLPLHGTILSREMLRFP